MELEYSKMRRSATICLIQADSGLQHHKLLCQQTERYRWRWMVESTQDKLSTTVLACLWILGHQFCDQQRERLSTSKLQQQINEKNAWQLLSVKTVVVITINLISYKPAI